ncbi:M24 family metallopeptidase [Aliikangiella sp. IMCC44653]
MSVYSNRISALRRQLSSQSCDAIIIANVSNVRYLSGFNNQDPHVAYLVITQNALHLITDYRFTQQAINECPLFSITERDRQKVTLSQQIKHSLAQLDVNRVAFEQDEFSYAQWLKIKTELEPIETMGISGWVEAQRMIKDSQELSLIKQAAQIADKAFLKLIPLIQVGISELELSIELEYQMQKLGSSGIAFPTILVSGNKTAFPHGLPSTKQLQYGDLITLDFGAVVEGYRSDMTRAIILGEPDQKQQAVYQTVLQAQAQAFECIGPNVPATKPYFAAKSVLDNSPYAKFQGEGLGHGVGLFLHEQPIMHANCQWELQPNMVITVEPGIYIPGWGGVRIEDDVIVTNSGYEKITQTDNKLWIID